MARVGQLRDAALVNNVTRNIEAVPPGVALFARKLQETQRHPHKRALVLSARHLLRTI